MRRLLVAFMAVVLAPLWAFPSTAGPLMATAPIQVSGASPFDPGCGLDPVDENSVLFLDSEVEPWNDVSPADPDIIAGMWQQDRWNDGGARGNVLALSVDGGANWGTFIPPNITECTANTGAAAGDFEVFDRASDPWLSFAPDGDLFLMHLVFDVELPEGLPGSLSGRNGMVAQRVPAGALMDGVIEDDEWDAPILLALDEGGDLHDKNTMTADPTVPTGTHVYAVWDFLQFLSEGVKRQPEAAAFSGLAFKGTAVFTRTTDGGQTWEPIRKLYDPGAINQTIGNQIVVRPDGVLVNVFNEILNFRNDEGGTQFDFNFALKRSPNKGTTWLPKGRPIRAAKMQGRTLFTPFPFVGVYDPDVSGNATLDGNNAVRSGGDVIPEIAVDPNNGNLYAVWQDARFSAAQAPRGFNDPTKIIDEIAFTMSTDGGSTWSTPMKVNQTPTTEPLGDRQAFTPMVRVNGDGVVAVSYYDFRNNEPGGIADTDEFVVHCHSNCSSPASWVGNEVRVTTAPFDLRELPFARGYFPGDYVGLGTDGEDFLPFFTQSAAPDPANEYFSRVSVG